MCFFFFADPLRLNEEWFSTQGLGLRRSRCPRRSYQTPNRPLNWFRGDRWISSGNRLRIEGTVVHLGTETSFNLLLSRLETIHETLGALVGILL
jgi:hypothetical protein